jgi:hypothetical protein
MGTLCTANLTLSNSTFCSRTVFLCFCAFQTKNAFCFLYGINRLVSACIMGTECDCCALRNEYLDVIEDNYRL